MSELEIQASVNQQIRPAPTSAAMGTLAWSCNNADRSHQENHPTLALLAANPQFFAQHGTVSTYWRRRGDKKYGPYYRLRYRDGQSTRTIYLGSQGPLVDRVCQTLQKLQRPLQERRALNQLHRQIRDALRADRRYVDAGLRSLGLRLKGFEVRGWRTSPLRNLARIPQSVPLLGTSSAERQPVQRQGKTYSPIRIGGNSIASIRLPSLSVPSTLPAFTPPKLALSPSIRQSQLRFIPKGRAAKWMRENHPKIPRLPQARLEAFLDARDRIRAASDPSSARHGVGNRGHERNRNRRARMPLWQMMAANLIPRTAPPPMRR
jgi:hypothetical protein